MVITKRLLKAFRKAKKLGLLPVTTFHESSIPYKKVPKLPKTKGLQKAIIKAIRKTGDTISGSYAQAVLTKYPRKFEDIDILSPNVKKTIREIKERLGDKVTFKKKFRAITVVNARTGKEIADIVPYEIGERIRGIDYVGKYGVYEVEGIKFVSPKTRLASKIAQLQTRKVKPKVLEDIRILTREKGFALKPKKQSLLSYKKQGGFKWF